LELCKFIRVSAKYTPNPEMFKTWVMGFNEIKMCIFNTTNLAVEIL